MENNMKRIWVAFLWLCLLAIPAQAQISSISGTVRDDVETLIGATVCEVDATGRAINATVTDMNGHFTMRVKSTKNKLKVSYMGYTTQTLPINKRNYDITLASASRTLKEVSVTEKKRISGGGLAIPEREISFASQTISTKEFEGLGINTIDEALQGRIAGLDIISNSGNLGSGTTMRLRGTSSISTLTNQNPLIVVNGNTWNVDMSTFDVNTANDESFAQLLNINPEDIEEITVLKDAAATAIYGSQGANGVIEIKTKRGKRGAPQVSYSFRLTGTYQPEGYKMLTGDEYTMLLKESYFNPEQSSTASNIPELNYDPTFSEYEQYNNNTDWQDAVTQWGWRQNHNISVTGGGEKATFRISGGYDHETGSIIEQQLDRFSTRLALDYYVSDRIKVSTNFAMTYTDNQKNYDDLLAIAYKKMPNMGIFEEDSHTGLSTGRYYEMLQSASSVFNGNQKDLVNPVASAKLAKYDQKTYDITPELEIQYDLLGTSEDEWQLRWNGRVNMNVFNEYNDKFYPQELKTVNWNNDVNIGYTNSRKSVAFDTKQTLTLTPYFANKDHSMMAMVRFNLISGTSNQQDTESMRLPSGGIESPDAGGQISSLSTGYSQWRSIYYTFSAHYAYKSRYMLDFSLRADGSTKFGPGKRWGVFPAVSARWNIIDESWMKWSRDWLSMLSIRPSWGRVGSQPTQDYLYESKYGSGDTYIDMNAMNQLNIRLTSLRWEVKSTYDVGMDFGFLDDRLRLTVEWYHSTTDGMLMGNVGIPSSTGFSSLAYKNVGKLRNLGWEFNITTNRVIRAGKFSADFNASFGNNKNEILEMDPTVLASLNKEFTQANRNVLERVQLNNPFGAIYGFRYKGVYQYHYDTFADMNEAERAQFLADGKTAPVAFSADGQVIYDSKGEPKRMKYCFSNEDNRSLDYDFKGGDAIYEDINHDGNINELDIVYLGSSLPKLTGGFGLTLTYDRWRLNAQFNYRVGNKILNLARLDAESMLTNNNQSQAVNYRWRKEGDVTSIPRAMYGTMSNGAVSNYNTLISDRFVEDGSFLRLNYLQLSYSLPAKAARAIRLKGVRAYLSANNLFCLTKYKGVDPEISYGSTGVAKDEGQTPRAKSFTLGVTVDF